MSALPRPNISALPKRRPSRVPFSLPRLTPLPPDRATADLTMAASLRMLALAMSAQAAAAWWCDGHMLTATVAKNCGIMSSTTFDAVESLVEELNSYYSQSPEFVSAACWADDLKTLNAAQESVSQLGHYHLEGAFARQTPCPACCCCETESWPRDVKSPSSLRTFARVVDTGA